MGEIQEAPVHPFVGAPEERRTAPTIPCRDGQAYTTTAKICDEKIAQDVYRHAMEALITVPQ